MTHQTGLTLGMVNQLNDPPNGAYLRHGQSLNDSPNWPFPWHGQSKVIHWEWDWCECHSTSIVSHLKWSSSESLCLQSQSLIVCWPWVSHCESAVSVSIYCAWNCSFISATYILVKNLNCYGNFVTQWYVSAHKMLVTVVTEGLST